MKFRKRLLALCSTLLLLGACKDYKVPPIMGNGGDGGAKAPEQTNEPGGTVNPPEKPTTPVDTYLVLSSVGLYKGEKGKSIEDKMLENAIVFNALPGADLPTKEDVTTIEGSKGEFEGWVCYEGTGFPTVYTKVPETAGMVLYATFKNGEGSGGGGGGGSTVTPSQYTTIYLDATQKLNDENETWASGNAAVTMHVWSYTTGDNAMIKMNNLGNGFYSGDVDLGKYTNVIFLRHANDKEAKFEDGGYWNKTGDLLFVADKNCFKITSWNDGGYWTNK